MHTHNAEATNFFIFFPPINNDYEVAPTRIMQADNYNYIVFILICFTNIAFDYTEIATVAKMFKIFLIRCAICINEEAAF
jgi:hypothetical protein